MIEPRSESFFQCKCKMSFCEQFMETLRMCQAELGWVTSEGQSLCGLVIILDRGVGRTEINVKENPVLR
jgi:hypothetical protein